MASHNAPDAEAGWPHALAEGGGTPLLDMVFQQAPAFMAVLHGPRHVFTLANDSYVRLVGGRTLIGRPLEEALPEVREQGFLQLLDEVLATGRPYVAHGARVMLANDGGAAVEERVLDFVYQPMRHARGEVVGVFVQGVDVTERLRTQQALRHSEERLALATDAAEVGLWDVDPIAATLYWPRRVREMFGIFSDRAVTMDDFYAGLHPGDRDAVGAAFAQALDPVQRALYDVEYRTVGREDGRIRWVAAKGRGLFDDAGRCVRVIGTAIDITARKHEQAELRLLNATLEDRVKSAVAERNLLADLIENSATPVKVADRHLRLLAANAAAKRIWNELYEMDLTVGARLVDVLARLPDAAWAQRLAGLWRRAVAGESFVELRKVVDRGGEHRAFELRFAPLTDPDGTSVGAYYMVYEVTERERGQEQLRLAEVALNQAYRMEAIGRLTGGIAHDFNNVLHVVSTQLELLDRVADDPARVRQLAAAARRSVQKGASLTGQLLAFSRQQSIDFTTLSARELAVGVADMLGRTVAPAELVLDLPDDPLWVRANATQLEMALLNLAANARDAMADAAGRVTLFARVEQGVPGLAPGAYVCLGLRDTGTGMPPDVLKKAFEPFFTTKPVGKGTGLGLNQVFGMARQGGGTATVDSVEGEGTTVRIYLRQAVPGEAAENAAPEAPTPRAAARHARLLVVDDEDEVRRAMVETLSNWGYEVQAAADGEAALGLLAAWAPDLLVLDYALPGMTGAALATQLRARWPQVPVVFTTGYADIESINAIPGPPAQVLRKPFELAALRGALQAQRGAPPAG